MISMTVQSSLMAQIETRCCDVAVLADKKRTKIKTNRCQNTAQTFSHTTDCDYVTSKMKSIVGR